MPAITKPSDHFNVVTYTATPGSGATVSGVGFQPDLLWTKNRNNVESHYLQDSVRGFSPSTGVTKMLVSNSTAAEANVTGITCTTTSDGFTVADSVPASGEFWFTDRTYVAWAWKAGGAAVTNTSGTISSQVSANPTAGFSVVTYTGNGTSGATVGHGLGVAPSMYIVKVRSTTESWITYHTSIGATNYLALNLTQASSAATAAWNNTAPTSTVFSLGNAGSTNGSGATFVAYCFAAVPGYSAFGSYTGNGSTDGPFVYLGFRPRFVLFRSTSVRNWVIRDTARDTFNTSTKDQYPDSAAVDGAGDAIDLLSNGFKLRATGATFNGSGETYIYAAFAEAPFKFASAC